MNEYLKKIAPTLVSFLAGAAAGVAVELIGNAFGISEPTKAKIESVLALKTELTGAESAALLGAEIEAQKMALAAAEAVNRTMQADPSIPTVNRG